VFSDPQRIGLPDHNIDYTYISTDNIGLKPVLLIGTLARSVHFLQIFFLNKGFPYRQPSTKINIIFRVHKNMNTFCSFNNAEHLKA